MGKVFECGSVVPGCHYVTHGANEDEVLVKAADHLHSAHEVEHLSERLKERIRAVVRDD